MLLSLCSVHGPDLQLHFLLLVVAGSQGFLFLHNSMSGDQHLSMLRAGERLTAIWLMNCCFCSMTCQLYASKVPPWYSGIRSLSYWFPVGQCALPVAPKSAGRHGQSAWCSAINLSCAFIPVHFRYLPISTRISCFSHFLNNAAFVYRCLHHE